MKLAFTLLTLLFSAVPSFAQQPTLEEVLTRLQQNSTIYTLSLPNFFVDENFTSQEFHGDKLRESVTTVSLLRVLHKAGDAHHPVTPVELREVRSINGKPAIGSRPKGPITLNGAFDTALTVFTASHVSCFTWKLLPSPDPRHLLLSFVAKNPLGDCPASIAEETGQALLDLQTIQPIQIDRTVPHADGAGQGIFLWSIDGLLTSPNHGLDRSSSPVGPVSS